MTTLSLRVVACAALLSASAAWARDSERVSREAIGASSHRVLCKVYVTEQGVAEIVEVLKIEPRTESDAEIAEAVKSAIKTWKLNPGTKDGKPVAGYVIMSFWVN